MYREWQSIQKFKWFGGSVFSQSNEKIESLPSTKWNNKTKEKNNKSQENKQKKSDALR